jgi:hypothetical protein
LIVLTTRTEGLEIERQLWKSINDDRCQRSLIEWWVIVSNAEKTSAAAAARKYYAKAPDGKCIHLRPKHIAKVKEKINAFWNKFQKYYPSYLRTQNILQDLIINDQYLLIRYQRLMEDHRNQINVSWQTERRRSGNLNQCEMTGNITYHNFSIRHRYDPKLYAIQKAKYKQNPNANPKPTGREEHKLDRSKVPRSIIEDLEKRGYSIT